MSATLSYFLLNSTEYTLEYMPAGVP